VGVFWGGGLTFARVCVLWWYTNPWASPAASPVVSILNPLAKPPRLSLGCGAYLLELTASLLTEVYMENFPDWY
jgi:hypothetical protein